MYAIRSYYVKGGFPESFADQLAAVVPEEMPVHEAWQLLQQQLEEQLRTRNNFV